MKIKTPQFWLVIVMLCFLIQLTPAQEKSAIKTGDEMEIVGLGFEKDRVAGAEIIKASINLAGPGNETLPSAGETQFDIKLTSRIVTNSKGEFVIEIPQEQFSRIPENKTFELKMQIKPPKEYTALYTSNEAKTKLSKQKGPRYELVLFWIREQTKSNKGTFAVSSKAQT